jgi:hypothetical protein
MHPTPSDLELDDGPTDQLPVLPHHSGPEGVGGELDHESTRAETDRHAMTAAPLFLGARARSSDPLRSSAEPQGAREDRWSTEGPDRDAKLAALKAEIERHRGIEQGLQNELGAARSAIRAERVRVGLLEGELAAVRDELADAKARALEDAAAHNREIAAKDRKLDEYELRIVVLQQELDKKLAVLQKLSAIGLPTAGLEGIMAERLGRDGEQREPFGAPALQCLTGDAPAHFILQKRSVTIGRSSQCDIQILTHFVSREHARLVIDGGNVVIEDLGSTNGVFVNSARVEHRQLQHADLITIGETRFRFVAAAAH